MKKLILILGLFLAIGCSSDDDFENCECGKIIVETSDFENAYFLREYCNWLENGMEYVPIVLNVKLKNNKCYDGEWLSQFL